MANIVAGKHFHPLCKNENILLHIPENNANTSDVGYWPKREETEEVLGLACLSAKGFIADFS
jgi:hypothetical protein